MMIDFVVLPGTIVEKTTRKAFQSFCPEYDGALFAFFY
jgi:hypothetical protein